MEPAILIDKLTKEYKKSGLWGKRTSDKPILAVRDVSFVVNKGELFGLLGPNGAGKTTLVKMLCTLVLPSSGSAIVAGFDLADEHAIRAATGLVVSDERSFFWRLSVQRNLDFFASLYGLQGNQAKDRIHAVLCDVDMQDRCGQEFSSLSTGMRQRIAIARALLHKPKILFLDEPTRSLDPIATKRVHALIQRLLDQKDMTVFLITHDLSEAEKLCHRVALMHEATIRRIGRIEILRQELGTKREYLITCKLPQNGNLKLLQEQIPSLIYTPTDTHPNSGEIRFHAGEFDGVLTRVIDYLREWDIPIGDIVSTPLTLEEIFAHYTAGGND
ncbi:MAG: ABC transporter ATP-binding protein [Candidatus Promineifilaceae bacterium]|nr:ABC transporter ATP-binding protein [Candidatus Promineifilaceae bacterium]